MLDTEAAAWGAQPSAQVHSATFEGMRTVDGADVVDVPPSLLASVTCAIAVVLCVLCVAWPKRVRSELSKAQQMKTAASDSVTSSFATSTGATAACTSELKNEETGTMDAPHSDAVNSAFAVVRRARALGLYLGDFMVSGISLGLPNANAKDGRPVFSPSNIDLLMRGESLIDPLPPDMLQAQLDRNIVQVVKQPGGVRERRPLASVEEVIKLASRIGKFDLAAEFGVDQRIVETLDATYALAIGAGLSALQDAGLISPPEPVGSNSTVAHRNGWKLAPEHREDTGVIFAASFPALDSLVDELASFMSSRLRDATAEVEGRMLSELTQLVQKLQEGAGEVESRSLAELSSWIGSFRSARDGAAPTSEPLARTVVADVHSNAAAAAPATVVRSYEFNRKLLFKLLVMANSQLAELVQARGPNLHINAACAGTTAALALGCDWMRAGRCRRVVVISADCPSSDNLLPWVGIGFLALGAATIKPKVEDAALPFDIRRNGMLLGAGAVALVLEVDAVAMARPMCSPCVKVLGTTHANSAYHASAIGTKHACEQLERLMTQVEVVHGLKREKIVESLLYVSHETFTCARGGGCAGSEIAALRSVFKHSLNKILITNTKGMTGHAMGVCFEDAVAVAALTTGRVPPVVNFREADPVLGQLRLSQGGEHNCKFALHFAAGFGSQIAYVLYGKI